MIKNILSNLNRSKSIGCNDCDTNKTSDKLTISDKLPTAKSVDSHHMSHQQLPIMGLKTLVDKACFDGDNTENEQPATETKRHRLLSRKGRARLSAMMSKLQSSMQTSKSRESTNKKQQKQQQQQQQQLHQNQQQFLSKSTTQPDKTNSDSEDDYDDYKSAEELGNMSAEEGDYYFDDIDHVSRKNSIVSTRKRSTTTTTTNNKTTTGNNEDILPEEQCDIPTFLHTQNADKHLIDETRRLLRERYASNPDSFYDTDYKRMLSDDWTVTRFLLRRRLDPKRTAKLMEECGRFRKQYKMSEVKLWEFPWEFHKAGGLFKYAPDKVGNITLFMRVKMYRRVPEISDVFKAFILCVLEECDMANNGRGTAIIFDLSGCGLQNVDLSFLSWLLSSFRNYCPKGVSYIIVYNLPWILNATCKLAMTWMSTSNRRSLRFASGDEIENFIARENLPDYCGGTCKLNYRRIPPGSRPAIEVCEQLEMSQKQALKIRELFKQYLGDDENDNDNDDHQYQLDSKSHYFDAKSVTNFTNNNNNTPEDDFELDEPNNMQTTLVDQHHQQQTTTIAGRRPVVDLVSQASKFIAH